jgi:glucosyl-dolichyl phosphate glucuronosyltransferase
MDCSVVICTRNRAAQLSEAVSSLTKLHIPNCMTRELLVVDNGSTDSTPDVIRSFETVLPIKRVFQPEPGISMWKNPLRLYFLPDIGALSVLPFLIALQSE